MIFVEFALEPEALVGWHRFQYLTGQFGFHTGRLISRFPGKWTELVRDTCRDLPDVERKMIITKLSSERFKKTKLIPSGRDFDPGATWFANALRHQDGSKPFFRVVAVQNPGSRTDVLVASAIDEDIPDMEEGPQGCVRRRADKLAGALLPLLQNSREIVFVDPHFNPSEQRWRPLLCACVLAATSGGRPVRKIEYHLEAPDSCEKFRAHCRDLLCPELPLDCEVTFVLWDDQVYPPEPLDLHPRLILTEWGGVHIDRGLDEHRRLETLATVLTKPVWAKFWSMFAERRTRYRLVDEVRAGRGGLL